MNRENLVLNTDYSNKISRKEKKLLDLLNKKELSNNDYSEWEVTGKEGYIFLRNYIKTGDLNDRQVANGLKVLFSFTRVVCFGLQNEVLEQALKLSNHESVEVRSSAVLIIIRLVKIAQMFPEFKIPFARKGIVKPFVEESLEMGVNLRETAILVEEFLTFRSLNQFSEK